LPPAFAAGVIASSCFAALAGIDASRLTTE
jgi:hypothetical protein